MILLMSCVFPQAASPMNAMLIRSGSAGCPRISSTLRPGRRWSSDWSGPASGPRLRCTQNTAPPTATTNLWIVSTHTKIVGWRCDNAVSWNFLVAQQLYMFFVLFLFHMSHPVHIRTSLHKLTNQTKLKLIFIDLIWLKMLRNFCRVPYLFF